MANKFHSLKAKMSPKARKRAEAKTQAMLNELPIRKLRETLNVDQAELAKRLHVKQPAISKQEARPNLGISTLKRYVEALGGTLEIRANFPEKNIRLM